MSETVREGGEAREFTVTLSKGRLVLRTSRVVTGVWTLERYTPQGTPQNVVSVQFGDILAASRWLREVVRVECYDDPPDLAELAASFEHDVVLQRRDTLQFAWLYRALATATARGNERDQAFLKQLGEVCATFLEQEPDGLALSHASRKVSGRTTLLRWTRLNLPVQQAMAELAESVVLALREAPHLHRQGPSAIESHLRERCGREFARFSGAVVWHVGVQLGAPHSAPERVRQRQGDERSLRARQCEDLEERLLKHIADRFSNARDPQADDLRRVVGLDPSVSASVRVVVRLALGVFLSNAEVDSRIRTFKFEPLTDEP